MVIRSTFGFALRRSWLLLPSAAAGAGAGYALDALSPVMAGGAALGLAPALAAGLALELRGHRLRTPDDVQRWHDLETLGAIARFEQMPGSAFPKDDHPEALQAYKTLAASLRARGGHELRTVLVTSAEPEEGKSTTAANLATVLAQSGSKVVLVDADLRWSSLRSTNAGASSLGLSGLLLNYLHSPQLAVVRTNEPNLFLLPAGVLPPNPHELLALPKLGDVIASLRTMADYVIFDSPPVLEAEDATLLARNVDATLLVTHAGKTRSQAVNKALRVLMEVDTRPLGAVLNRVKRPRKAAEPAVRQPVAQPEATASAPAPATEPAFDPFTIEAFRRGAPKPASAHLPRRREPEPEPAVMRLAQQGFESGPPSPSPANTGFDSPDYGGHLAALRTLRIVPPDERPAAPAVSGWEPVVASNASHPTQVPVPGAAGVEAGHPAEMPALSTAGVSADEVLAHMEETLRLIREMRREKSVTSS